MQFGVSLDIHEADCCPYWLPNGAGNQPLNTIYFGLVKADSGTITLDEKPCRPARSPRLLRLAWHCAPEGRRVFSRMSVLARWAAIRSPIPRTR